MSGVIDFSYNTFYKYYTNTNNSKTETDKRIKEIYFYKNNKNNKKPEQSNTSTNYIIIHPRTFKTAQNATKIILFIT